MSHLPPRPLKRRADALEVEDFTLPTPQNHRHLASRATTTGAEKKYTYNVKVERFRIPEFLRRPYVHEPLAVRETNHQTMQEPLPDNDEDFQKARGREEPFKIFATRSGIVKSLYGDRLSGKNWGAVTGPFTQTPVAIEVEDYDVVREEV